MYAHINVWQLSDQGNPTDNTSSEGMAARLREQPGFASYTLIRTGEREVTAVTVFRSRDQLEAALRAVGPFFRDQVRQFTDGQPERREGEVLQHEVGVVLPDDI